MSLCAAHACNRHGPKRAPSRFVQSPWRSDFTLRLARWSVYSVIAVVLVFGATLVYTQLVLEPIEERTDALTENALPSVKQLSVARGALVRMQAALHANGRASAQSEVDDARRELDAALASYLMLPQFSDERRLSVDMSNAVAVLEEHLDEARATGNVNGESFAPLVQAADAAIQRTQLVNIDHGIDATVQIDALKRRSRAISLALSGASLFMAIVTSWLVFRAARRQTELAVEHEALLTTRATELEAFAGRIAHDLKAPLGTLALRLALMKSDGEPEHVDKAVRQVERIDHIIEGLLAYARAGANPPPHARAQLRDVVDEVVEDARPKAQAVEAALEVDPFPPSVVACTPGALWSVLSNLLGNAIKYVVEGQSPIRKIVVHVEELEKNVRVEVVDSGPGLPAGAERSVFQPRQPARGLGLATVKRIVEGFGGRVGVRSVLGRGSIFWFEIPKAEGGA